MIEEDAVVTRLDNSQIWVKRLHSGGCGACPQQSACGTPVLSKLLPKREFKVDNDIELKVGDKVTVAVDDSQLLLSSFLLYLMPLLLMILSVLLVNALLPAAFVEHWLPVLALLVLLLSFYLIHHLEPLLLFYINNKAQLVPKPE